MRFYGKLLLCAALMLLPGTVLCEPGLTNGVYTAYIGENNWLYLQNAEGTTKYMPSVIYDLPAMDDEKLYCISETGALWSVQLDGSASAIVSAEPTEEELSQLEETRGWTLRDGVLTVPEANRTVERVLCAAQNGTMLYYVTENASGVCAMTAMLTDASQSLLMVPTCTVEKPVSLTVSTDYAVLVTEQRTLQLIDLQTWTVTEQAAPSEQTATAFCHEGKLYCYTRDADGHYVVEAVLELNSTDTARSLSNSTAAATAAPTPTATPHVTAVPTATAKATA